MRSPLLVRPIGGARRIGILGGSFNPAHGGHRYISLEALKRLALDEVWWLVSPQNPLKPRTGMAPLDQRVAAARCIADHPRVRVGALEQTLGTHYTADTAARLVAIASRTRFVWLMGADNLAEIERWRRWPSIFGTVAIAVFARSSYDSLALAGAAAHRFRRARVPAARAAALALREPPAWVFLRLRPHPASATRIRATGGWDATNGWAATCGWAATATTARREPGL